MTRNFLVKWVLLFLLLSENFLRKIVIKEGLLIMKISGVMSVVMDTRTFLDPADLVVQWLKCVNPNVVTISFNI